MLILTRLNQLFLRRLSLLQHLGELQGKPDPAQSLRALLHSRGRHREDHSREHPGRSDNGLLLHLRRNGPSVHGLLRLQGPLRRRGAHVIVRGGKLRRQLQAQLSRKPRRRSGRRAVKVKFRPTKKALLAEGFFLFRTKRPYASLATFTSSAKALGSVAARLARTLRFSVTPALAKPDMKAL